MTSALQICFVWLVSSKIVFKSDAWVHRYLAVDLASESSVVQCDVGISARAVSKVVNRSGDISDGSWFWRDVGSIFQLRQVPG
jgi:hypothetical protein